MKCVRLNLLRQPVGDLLGSGLVAAVFCFPAGMPAAGVQ
jgi:hypothetical protein